MLSTGPNAGDIGKNKADKSFALMELSLMGETVNKLLPKSIPEDIVL